MAKGMGNGFPIGAVIAQKHVAEPMGDKFLFHTYGANPTSCAAGRAVLEVLREDRLQENALKVGNSCSRDFGTFSNDTRSSVTSGGAG